VNDDIVWLCWRDAPADTAPAFSTDDGRFTCSACGRTNYSVKPFRK